MFAKYIKKVIYAVFVFCAVTLSSVSAFAAGDVSIEFYCNNSLIGAFNDPSECLVGTTVPTTCGGQTVASWEEYLFTGETVAVVDLCDMIMYYVNEEGVEHLTFRPKTYSSAATYACAAGYYLPANSTTCSLCPKGYRCAGGTWSKSSSNQGLTQCTGNTYQASTGQSVCVPCASGYTISGTAVSYHDAESDCKRSISAGYYHTSSNTVVACAAGKYKTAHTASQGVATSCTNCPIGSYTSSTTSPKSSCTVCSGGKTTSAAGQTSCNANCSNSAGVATWTASWWSSGAKNVCAIATCSSGYTRTGSAGTTSSYVCTGNKYTVTLNRNGGSGGTASVSATYGSAMPSITVPTRIGYVFEGYYDATGGTQYYTAAGASARTWNKTAATTLYARWTARTYTIHYQCTSGTDTSTKTCTLNSADCKLDYTGCNATGSTVATWHVKAGGVGTDYEFDTAVGTDLKAEGYLGSVATQSAFWTDGGHIYITKKSLTCASGKFLAANGTSCSTCTAGYKCAGGTYTISTSAQGRTQCSAGQWSAAGASSCSTCPTNYTSSAGATAQNKCYIKTTAGNYVATANAAQVTCAAGGYCPGNVTVYYGSTGGRTACSCGYYNGSTGSSASSACTKTSAGYYAAAGATSQTKASAGYYAAAGACSQTQCGTGKYSGAGASSCSTCPTNYPNSAAGSDASNDCYLTTTAGKYVASANAAQTTCAAGGYCPGGTTVKYGSTGGRTACSGATYNASTGSSASSACTACPSGYTYNTTAGKTAASSCQIQCPAGTMIAAKNATCTSPAGAWYATTARVASYGNFVPVNYCAAGYTSSGTAASNHDAVSDCTKTVAGASVAKTIPARYIRLKSAGNTVNSYGTHVVEIQAFASYNDSGTNLLSGKGGSGSNPTRATDGSLANGTYASATSNNYITWDMGSTQNIGLIKLAMYSADLRTYNNVQIEVSTNNSTWTTVFGPMNIKSPLGSSNTSTLEWILLASQTSCAVGTYAASSSVALGSTKSCSACSGATQYQNSTGQTSCKTVSDGYYKSSNSAQTACGTGYYCKNAVRTQCPNGGTTSTTTASAISSCYKTGLAYNATHGDGTQTCYYTSGSGTSAVYSTSCSSKTITGCDAGYYLANASNTDCTAVGAGYYSGSGTTLRSTCPSGYDDGSTTATAQSECKIKCSGGTYVASANAACTSVGTGYWSAGATVAYGGTSSRTQCPANYRSGAAASSQAGCKTSCSGGTYVASANAACTSVGTGYWSAGATVAYGSTSSRTQCPANYRSGAAASSQAGCKASCSAGTRVASANAACSAVGSGKYMAAHTVNYGSTSAAAGTCPSDASSRTVKSPSGAAAATDCYVECSAKSISNGSAPAVDSSPNYNGSSYPACKWNTTCNAGYYGADNTTNPSCTICAAGTYNTTTNQTSCTTCPANSYCTGGSAIHACSELTTGVDANGNNITGAYPKSDAGAKAGYSCYTTTTAGKYIETPGGGEVTCPVNYYCPGGSKIYVSSQGGAQTGGAVPCPTGYRSNAGASSCTANTFYISYAANSGSGSAPTSPTSCTYNGTCTAPSNTYTRLGYNFAGWKCTGGTSGGNCDGDIVAAGGSIKNATATNGATVTLTAQWTAKSITCSAGKYLPATSETCSTCTAGYACAGGTFTYTGSIQGRTQCTGATYSASGASSCTNCPSGYTYNTTAGKTAASSCQIQCPAGTMIVTKNATCTSPAGAWYATNARVASYGNFVPVNFCMAGYTSSGTAASNHDAASDCTKTVAGASVAKTIPARYIKLTSAGNTVNSGNHVIEIQAFASSDGTGTNLLSGKGGSGTNPTRATDGSLANGTYASGTLVWDMGSTQNIGSIKFAMYSYDLRTYNNVTISVSTNNSTWTTVMGPQNVSSPKSGSNSVLSLLVLAGQTSCAAGTYAASSSVALGGTKSCSSCSTGYHSSAGASSCTANTFNISYAANSGSGSAPTSPTSCTYNGTCTAPSNTYTRTGYTFNGWKCTGGTSGGNCDGDIIAAGGSIKNATATNGGTITLTAQWKANTYTVSFNVNGGSGGQSANVTATYGSAMPTISTTKPTRTGYTFGGWYDTSAASGGTQYYTAAGASARTWNKTANTTLYARWTANTYTVSFNVNGGSGGQSANVTATYGSAMPTISTTAPTRKSYVFAGWYDTSAASGGTQYYTAAGASARTWNKAANTTLYARWTQCSAGSYCQGDNTSKACPTDYPNSAAGSDASNDCYLTTTSGKYVASANAAQTTCAAGGYCPGNVTVKYGSTGGRTACSAGTANGNTGSNASSACVTCAAGTYTSTTGQTSCATCPANSYCLGGSDVRKCSDYGTIPDGQDEYVYGQYPYSVAGSKELNACYRTITAGYYIPRAGAGETPCLAGNYCPGDSTTKIYVGGSGTTSGGMYACAKGSYTSTTGQSACAACNSGKTTSSTGKTSCSDTCSNSTAQVKSWTAATWNSNNTVSNNCTISTCTDGYHVSGNACVANTYTVAYNANGGTGTTASSSHTYDTSKALTANGFTNGVKKFLGWSTSSSATTATYIDKASVKNLTTTNGGTVTLYAIWGTCTACSGNTGANCTLSAPKGVCTYTTSCKGGYGTLTNGGKYNATCSQCSAGTASADGVNTCSTCSAGTYSGAGASSCSTCPTNYTSDAGATAQNKCYIKTTAGNYVATANAGQVTCAAGGYCPGGTTVYYGSTGGRTACSCGYYNGSTGSSASTACTKTSAGYYAAAGATSQTKATAGYYAAAGACSQTQCTGAKYSGAGAASCTDCPSGYTANTTAGKTAATSCQIQCSAGTRVNSANAACSTPNNSGYTWGWYTAQHVVNYGKTSANSNKVSTCSTGYTTPNNTTASSHDASSDCAVITYTITYNLNSGTNSTSNPSSYNVTTATITLASPTRTGYTFAGWYTESGFTNKVTQIAQGSTGNKTFYAKWTANTYTVSFNVNGGSGGQSVNVTATYDSAMPTISTTAPTRTGYTFAGWYDAKSGGTQYYTSAGASARTWNKTANTTLYARWTAKSIKCDAGKYLRASDATCQTCLENYFCTGSTFTYNGSDQGLIACNTRVTGTDANGNDIVGAYPKSNAGASSADYCYTTTEAGKYVKDAGNGQIDCERGYFCPGGVEIYNQNTLGLTQTGGMSKCVQGSYTSSTGASVCTSCAGGKTNNSEGGNTSCSTTCSNSSQVSGWKTTTWNTNNTVSNLCTVNTCNTGYEVKSNACSAKKYTVTYNCGTGTGTAPSAGTATYNSTFTPAANTCTKTGYTFNGWLISGTTTTQSLGFTWKYTEAKTFTAQWTANAYTVVFNKNGGSGSMSNLSRKYDDGVALTANAFTRTGYTFNGWNTAANGSGTSYANKATTNLTTTAGATVTLYAQWTANTYTVVFNSNKPSTASASISGTMSNQSRTYNDGKSLTANAYSLTGWTFAGWNTKADGSGTNYANKATSNLTSTSGATVTLYAKWTASCIPVTFDLNYTDNLNPPQSKTLWKKADAMGWYVDNACSSSYTAASDKDLILPAEEYFYDTDGKEPYVFRGYYDKKHSDATNNNPITVQYFQTDGVLSAAGSNLIINSPITVYAAWATPCQKPSNGTCTLEVETDGDVHYSATCQTGYNVVDYATYTPKCQINTYTVAYYDGSTKLTNLSPTSYTVTTDTFALPTPYKSTKKFVSWHTDSGLTSSSVVTQVVKGSTGNKTYYAKWETCPAGYACNGSSITECTGSTYATAGASSCTSCPAATGWAITSSVLEQGGITDANGTNANNMANRVRIKATEMIYLKAGAYTISFTNTSAGIVVRGFYVYSEPDNVAKFVEMKSGSALTLSSDAYVRAVFQKSNASTAITPAEVVSAGATLNKTNAYVISGTGVSNHDNVNDCKISCPAGTYVAVANGVCVPVASGKYAAASTVAYGSAGSVSTCPATNSGSDKGRAASTACYYTCPSKTVSNGTTTIQTAKVYYSGSSYPVCTYNVTCNTGYTANGSGTANPTCIANKYEITLNGNGATTAGTTKLYTTFATGVYTDSGRSTAMSTTANGITVPQRKYTVTYNANGGSVSTASATSTYEFKGMYDSTSGTSQYIGSNGRITNAGLTKGTGTAGAQTWYAQWTSKAVTLPTPSRTGYTFAGWYTAASGGTKIGAAGASYTPTANITVYAQWTANTYTVVFNSNKPSTASASISGTMSNQSRTYNDGKSLTANAYSLTGWTFAGWNTKADGSGTNYANKATGNLTSTSGATVTLYAKWTASCIPVTFDLNYTDNLNPPQSKTLWKKADAMGWYVDNACSSSYTAASDKGLILPAEEYFYDTDGKEPYVFRGYYDKKHSDATNNNPITVQYFQTDGVLSAAGSNLTINSPITVYAAWATPCQKPSNGTCTLEVETDGDVHYSATCQTGYTVSGYATYTPSCVADCNEITLNPNSGTAGSVAKLYKKTAATGWYTNSSCTTAYSTTTNIVPTRSGYTFRGFFASDLSDVSADDNTATAYLNKSGASTTSGTNWTVNTAKTIYAAWAASCQAPSTGTCTLTVSDGGAVDYTGGCNTGYTLGASNTYKPTCTANKYEITLNGNGATTAGTTKLYTTFATGVYTDSGRSTAMSTTANGITVPQRKYTVTYNANGGSVSTASATSTYEFKGMYDSTSGTSQYIGSNGRITDAGLTKGKGTAGAQTWYAQWTSKAVTLPTPSRSGYTFAGWYTNSGLTGTSYAAGASYTPTANVTLYAKWTANNYEISLNNSGATTAGTTKLYTTFATGVYTDSDRSTAMSTTANGITVPQRKYTVTYNANGGSVSTSSATSTYEFNGMYDSTSGTSQYIGSNGRITDAGLTKGKGTAGNQTWYAQWTSKAVTLPTPSRTGYTFAGWYTAASGGTKIGAAGASYTPTANITVYAQWTANNYEITLNGNGATSNGTTKLYPKYNTGVYTDSDRSTAMSTTANGITVPSRSYTVTYNVNGGSVSPSSATATYEFKGMYDSTSGTSQYIGSNGRITDAGLTKGKGTAGNQTWYAQWTSKAVTLPTPSRTGYTFAGWYTAASGGTKIGAAGASYTPTANITVYAQWTPNNYEITLNGNGATSNGTTKLYTTYATGTYLDSSRSKLMDQATNAITRPSRSYTVTFNANGGSVASGTLTANYTYNGFFSATSDGTKYIGSEFLTADGVTKGKGTAGNQTWYAQWTSKAVTLPTPSRSGYTFAGWYTAASGGTKIGAAGASYTPTANITVYAQWTANNYEITLNGNGATTAGTTKLYPKYNTAVYLDSSRTKAMSESANAITAPSRVMATALDANGGSVTPTSVSSTYKFNGFYDSTTGSNQYIGSNNYITSAGLTKGKGNVGNQTWYAQWTLQPSTLPTPTRTGYTFKNWNTKADGTGTSYAAGVSTLLPAGTLYAQWTPNNYEIVLNPGTDGTGGMSKLYTTYDTSVYTDSSRTKSMGLATNGLTSVPSRSYTVTYNANGGSVSKGSEKVSYLFDGYGTSDGSKRYVGIEFITSDGLSAAKTNTNNSTTWYAQWISQSATLPTPSRTGYTFAGWYTNSGLTGTSYAAGASYTPTANVTLYAKWNANIYTVTLDSKYYATANTTTGIDATTNADPSKIYLKYNTGWYTTSAATTAFSKLTAIPTYKGYIFGGFYTGKAGSGTQIIDANGAVVSGRLTTFAANKTLYAKWIVNCIPVTFDLNYTDSLNPPQSKTLWKKADLTGWYVDNACSSSYTAASDKDLILPAEEYFYDADSKEPYVFRGYYDKKHADATENTVIVTQYFQTDGVLSAAGSNLIINSPITVYAAWATPCQKPANGTCTLEVETDGDVHYSATCQTGYTVSGYATYTPSCVANEYTVVFNSNKPEAASASISGTMSNQPRKYNDGVALTTNAYKLTGWSFAGWNTAADGSGTSYADKAVANLASTSGAIVNLYAQWTPCTYTVKYNSNKPSTATASITGSTASSSHTYETAKSLTANGYKLTGWTFTGWNTKADGSGTRYADKASVKNLVTTCGGSITLYAQWTACTYTVNYNSNKPSTATASITGSTASSSHTYDTAKVVTSNGYKLTGWTFTGWNTKADGSGTRYADKASVKNLTSACGGSVTLYAQWIASCIPVTFDLNYTDSLNPPQSKTLWKKADLTGWYTDNGCSAPYAAASDKDLILPGEVYFYDSDSKEPYVFRGYYDKKHADATENTVIVTQYFQTDGVLSAAGSNLIINSPITVYAAWATPCQKPANGTCTLEVETDGDVHYSATCQTGYTVSGYATYTPSCVADCNKITLDANGGTAGTVGALYKKTAETGWYANSSCTTAYSTTANIVPTRSGYTFRGFFASDLSDVSADDNTATAYLNKSGASTTSGTNWTVNAPKTIYAVWAASCQKPDNGTCSLAVSNSGAVDYSSSCNTGYTLGASNTYAPSCTANKYAVVFNSNKPSTASASISGTMSNLSREYDDGVALTSNAYTLTGWTFKNWNTAANGSGTSYANKAVANLTATSGATVTLYAQWTAKSSSVTLDKNATDAAAGTTSVNPVYDSAMPTPITLPTRSGYTFAGYYDTANATGGKQYYTSAGKSARNWDKTGAQTLYARWSANCNQITLNPNGGTAGSTDALYKKTDATGWYSDSTCGVVLDANVAAQLIATRSGYTFRGFYKEQKADVTSFDATGTQYLHKDGTSTDDGANWTVKAPATIYAAWAQNCAEVSNGKCTLNVSNDGSVTYITNCNAGFGAAGVGTRAPTCTKCLAGTFSAGGTNVCAICNGNTYSGAGAASCTSCPSGYSISGTAAGDHDTKSDCKITCSAGTQVVTADALCTTPDNSGYDWGWYTGTHTVSAGSTSGSNVKSCAVGYETPNTTVKANHDASSDCAVITYTITYMDGNSQMSGLTPVTYTIESTPVTLPVVAYKASYEFVAWYANSGLTGSVVTTIAQGSTGNKVFYAKWQDCPAGYACNGSSVTQCTGSNWAGEGSSACTPCPSGYTYNKASGMTKAELCQISCAGGSYVATAKQQCVNVGEDYYKGAHVVNYGSTSTRNKCSSDLTTIGYGAGADESGDCGRILHVDGQKLYLRSAEKTDVSLHVKVAGVTFFGNMVAGDKKMSDGATKTLKIKHNGITYSVYDDSVK